MEPDPPFQLPPPPPAPPIFGPVATMFSIRPQRAGELTPGWRTVTIVCWIGVTLGIGAAGFSSRKLGLSAWWLGPETDPVFPALTVLPFIMPVLVAVMAMRSARYVPWFGLAASAATFAVAFGDRSPAPGIAAIEAAMAASGLAITLASFSGLLRPAPAATDSLGHEN